MAAKILQPVQWTAEQSAAIITVGRELLVSAGAGSGKTAVLAERCAHLVTQADPRSSVERLLVLTFTDAAAAEMRSRIHRSLQARLSVMPNDPWLREQAALADMAAVSTLHGFCRGLLIRHAAAADIDPEFDLLTDGDSKLLPGKILDELFDDLQTGEHELSESFFELCMLNGGGGTQQPRLLILRLHEFLASLPDPHAWRANVQAKYENLPAGALTPEWHAEHRLLISDSLDELCALAEDELRGMQSAGLPPEIVGPAGELSHSLESWRQRVAAAVTGSDLDAICQSIVNYKPPKKLTRASKQYKNADPDEQAALDAGINGVDRIIDAIKSRLKNVDARYSDAQWAEGLRQVAPHVQTVLAVTTLFEERYRQAKRDRNLLDYADLERVTLRLLSDAPHVAAAIRRQFDYVLVDEYQDINPLQDAILRHVAHICPAGGGHPNLFCVGDVKQSIYRFRHAEPELFASRHAIMGAPAAATDGMRIDLAANFRSDPPVLHAINAIMRRLMTRELGGIAYDHSAMLRPPASPAPSPASGPSDPAGCPASAAQAADTPIEIHVLRESRASEEDTKKPEDDSNSQDSNADGDDETDDWDRTERETAVLGRRLQVMRADTPGLMWRDIAILMRSMGRRAAAIIRMLARLGIPAYSEKVGGFFDSLEVRDVLAILNLLDNARQDLPLAAVLRSPIMCGCAAIPADALPLTDEQLACIRIHRPKESFADAVSAYAQSGPEAHLRTTVAAVLEQLRVWRHVGRCHDIAETIARIEADTGYRHYAQALADGPRRAANLIALHEHARNYSSDSHEGLPGFVRFLREIDDGDHAMRAGVPLSSAADVVRIMTIHGAKGLEFPVVVLLQAGQKFNMNDAQHAIIFDRVLGLGLKAVDADRRITWPTLAHRRVAARIRHETLSEEMRLLYVALTRAKRRILIVGSSDKERIAGAPSTDIIALGRRRAAMNALNWVLDAVGPAPDPRLFAVYEHDAVPAGGDMSAPPSSTGAQRLQRAADLLPLQGVPPSDVAAATELVSALERPYQAAALAQVPSVIAVTELKRRMAALADPESPSGMLPGVRDPSPRFWLRPNFVAASREAGPTHRGTAVHLALEHLDLSGACDTNDIQRQLHAMRERGVLSAEDAALVDADDIAWVFQQPVGQDLRLHRATVQRELDFMMAEKPQRFDPAAPPLDADDFMVMRGIIDCLYQTPDGLTIIDWKTDHVNEAQLADRVRLYSGQLRLYADALGALLRAPVHSCKLVFLTARQVVSV